jgi:molecular chaperone IbpB/HSP20 family protein
LVAGASLPGRRQGPEQVLERSAEEVVMNKDNKFPFMDLNKFLDEVFGQVEGFSEKFQSEMEKSFHNHGPWSEGIDFYPGYAYPPMNVYLTAQRDLVIEMALAGFSQDDLELQFVGDYLHFSARPQTVEETEGLRYLKRRLKLKPVEQQKYYVPADKFDQTRVSAAFKDGLLKIVIPSKEDVTPKEGVKVNINS